MEFDRGSSQAGGASRTRRRSPRLPRPPGRGPRRPPSPPRPNEPSRTAAAAPRRRRRAQHAQLAELESEARHLARVAELLAEFRNTVVASVGPRLAVQAAELFARAHRPRVRPAPGRPRDLPAADQRRRQGVRPGPLLGVGDRPGQPGPAGRHQRARPLPVRRLDRAAGARRGVRSPRRGPQGPHARWPSSGSGADSARSWWSPTTPASKSNCRTPSRWSSCRAGGPRPGPCRAEPRPSVTLRGSRERFTSVLLAPNPDSGGGHEKPLFDDDVDFGRRVESGRLRRQQ